MLDAGESIVSVAQLLGQVPSTTSGNYSHALRRGNSIAGLLKGKPFQRRTFKSNTKKARTSVLDERTSFSLYPGKVTTPCRATREEIIIICPVISEDKPPSPLA